MIDTKNLLELDSTKIYALSLPITGCQNFEILHECLEEVRRQATEHNLTFIYIPDNMKFVEVKPVQLVMEKTKDV